MSAACASETTFQERGGPYHFCLQRSSSSERLLFSRSSQGVPRPQPCRRLPSTLRLASAISFSQLEHSIWVCQFPPPGGPLLHQPPPRQSLQGRGGVLRCSSGTPWGRAVETVPKLQWQSPSRQIFFFNPKVLTLKLYVFPGHSYFVCFSISIYGKSLPWRSSRSRGNRR